MLRKCLKRFGNRWKSEDGSAQVIEFSYVFPVVVLTILGLLSLTFVLFYYVYAFNMTERAADLAVRDVGGNRVYWQLLGTGVPPERREKLADDLQDRMDRVTVVPGLQFSTSLSVNGPGSRVTAKARCTYFGTTVFSVRSDRDILKPTEYAQNVDLLGQALDDTGIREKLETVFGRFLTRDKTYEVL